MFGIFAKGKAARLGLQIKNWITRSTAASPPVKFTLPKLPSLDGDAGGNQGGYHVTQVSFKNDKRMPIGTRMFMCNQGYFMRKNGYAAWSGPCPTKQAAQRTALRNMGY